MKALLLCLALTGCAAQSPPLTSICAVQVVKVIRDDLFLARQHCEPDGEHV